MADLELVNGRATSLHDDFRPSGGYERGPDSFHLQFDPTAESVTHAVIGAAAFVHNVDQSDLEPLARAINPDALEALLGGGGRSSTADVEVTFVYEGLEITVADDGDIWLRWI